MFDAILCVYNFQEFKLTNLLKLKLCCDALSTKQTSQPYVNIFFLLSLFFVVFDKHDLGVISLRRCLG